MKVSKYSIARSESCKLDFSFTFNQIKSWHILYYVLVTRNNFSKKVSSYPPKKRATPQHPCASRSPAWRQHFFRSRPDATRHESSALRLCCVDRCEWSATPEPMNGKACRPTLRRGGKFEEWLGADCDVFEKSFFAIGASGFPFQNPWNGRPDFLHSSIGIFGFT
jgi:hypothetical protein